MPIMNKELCLKRPVIATVVINGALDELSVEQLQEKFMELLGAYDLSRKKRKRTELDIKSHYESNYPHHELLCCNTKVIIQILEDNKLSTEEKSVLINPIMDAIPLCTEGFLSCLNFIVMKQRKPRTLDDILYLIRHDLVDKVARASFPNRDDGHDTHRYNLIFADAVVAGCAVLNIHAADVFDNPPGFDLIRERVIENLKNTFDRHYNFWGILASFEQTIRYQLAEFGYSGLKQEGTYLASDLARCLEYLGTLISLDGIPMERLLIVETDGHVYKMKDFNWQLIFNQLFISLKKGGYFTFSKEEEKMITFLLNDEITMDSFDQQASDHLMGVDPTVIFETPGSVVDFLKLSHYYSTTQKKRVLSLYFRAFIDLTVLKKVYNDLLYELRNEDLDLLVLNEFHPPVTAYDFFSKVTKNGETILHSILKQAKPSRLMIYLKAIQSLPEKTRIDLLCLTTNSPSPVPSLIMNYFATLNGLPFVLRVIENLKDIELKSSLTADPNLLGFAPTVVLPLIFKLITNIQNQTFVMDSLFRSYRQPNGHLETTFMKVTLQDNPIFWDYIEATLSPELQINCFLKLKDINQEYHQDPVFFLTRLTKSAPNVARRIWNLLLKLLAEEKGDAPLVGILKLIDSELLIRLIISIPEIVSPLLEILGSKLADGRALPNALLFAAQKGYLELVSMLLEYNKRMRPDQETSDATMALFIAAQNGHFEVVSALLADENVDPNKANERGETALSTAISNKHTDVVDILLNYYLLQMIKYPTRMSQTFAVNPSLLTELVKQRQQIWDILKDPVNVHLRPPQHCELLKKILPDSSSTLDQAHPLHDVFSDKKAPAVFFKDKKLVEIRDLVQSYLAPPTVDSIEYNEPDDSIEYNEPDYKFNSIGICMFKTNEPQKSIPSFKNNTPSHTKKTIKYYVDNWKHDLKDKELEESPYHFMPIEENIKAENEEAENKEAENEEAEDKEPENEDGGNQTKRRKL